MNHQGSAGDDKISLRETMIRLQDTEVSELETKTQSLDDKISEDGIETHLRNDRISQLETITQS